MYAPAGVAALAGAFCRSRTPEKEAPREKLANRDSCVNRAKSLLSGLAFGTLADMGKLDPDDPRAPYQQIADDIRSSVVSGDLAPGSQLPSLQALADEYGVSIGTVKSGLAKLREDGLIVTRHGRGSFVRTQLPSGDAEPSATEFEALRQTVASLEQRVEALEKRLGEQ